jgi:hypothetical protein
MALCDGDIYIYIDLPAWMHWKNDSIPSVNITSWKSTALTTHVSEETNISAAVEMVFLE